MYGYGYDLTFTKNKHSHAIFICKLKKSPLPRFPYRVSFETNQLRTISLRAEYDFTNVDSLKRYLFVVDDVILFLCDADKKEIFYLEDKNYSEKLMEYWLIHIVLPIYFTLNNTYYFLHSGCISVNDRATLFMGSSYAGKSTLTDYFLKKEHNLVSDDKLATYELDNKFYCVSSHPFHRPYRELESLGIQTDNFSKSHLMMGNIYWIEPVKAKEDICIEELKGLKKFEVLRYSTEMDIYVNQEKRFEYITKLANTLKVYKIQIPRDLQRLEEVYETIIEHTKL